MKKNLKFPNDAKKQKKTGVRFKIPKKVKRARIFKRSKSLSRRKQRKSSVSSLSNKSQQGDKLSEMEDDFQKDLFIIKDVYSNIKTISKCHNEFCPICLHMINIMKTDLKTVYAYKSKSIKRFYLIHKACFKQDEH